VDIDLSSVGDPLYPWNFLGEDQVYVAFEFESVSTVTQEDEGVWVDDVLIQKTHPSPLEAPTGVAATEDQINQISVSWNAATGATQYQVYRAQGADNPGQAAPVSNWQAGRTFVDTNVLSGTSYFYYVKAGDGAVQSGLSAGDEGRAIEDPNATASQSFVISNAGPGTLSVTGIDKRDGSAWLTFTPPRGFPLTIPPGGQESIAVKASSTGLANGTYVDRLVIRNNTADANPFPDGVDITFTVGTGARQEVWSKYR